MGKNWKRRFSPKEEGRIRRAISQKVQFFAPTISPAPKNVDRNEIESLDSAIRYFYENGAQGVVIQPKYMGSYCDIYMRREIGESRFYSRRGYPVRLDHEEMINSIRSLHDHLFDELFPHADLIIVQSELMPWYALGGGLIERDFGGYGISHRAHHAYLDSTSLNDDVQKLLQDPNYHQFLIDQGTMDRKTLKAAYPAHIVSQYEALFALSLPDLKEYKEDIDLFDKQLKRYGADEPLHFKPFNILKIVYSDGLEKIPDDHTTFSMVSDIDLAMTFRFDGDGNPPGPENDRYLDEMIKKAYEFYSNIIGHKKMEGVVVKPIGSWNPDVVPMFKVRSNDYLQLIYGVNFNRDFDYYLSRRGVGKKMRASKNQWNIAQAVLRIPMADISKDHEEYTRLVRARIYEEDFEKTLDSRL